MFAGKAGAYPSETRKSITYGRKELYNIGPG